MCQKCQQYGHALKYCKNLARCYRYGKLKHERNDCRNQICCLHCNLSHEEGDRECVMQQKEQVVCDIDQKQHVNRRRVWQLVDYGDYEKEIQQKITTSKNFGRDLFYKLVMDKQY